MVTEWNVQCNVKCNAQCHVQRHVRRRTLAYLLWAEYEVANSDTQIDKRTQRICIAFPSPTIICLSTYFPPSAANTLWN